MAAIEKGSVRMINGQSLFVFLPAGKRSYFLIFQNRLKNKPDGQGNFISPKTGVANQIKCRLPV